MVRLEKQAEFSTMRCDGYLPGKTEFGNSLEILAGALLTVWVCRQRVRCCFAGHIETADSRTLHLEKSAIAQQSAACCSYDAHYRIYLTTICRTSSTSSRVLV
jgi:hypothetical protein